MPMKLYVFRLKRLAAYVTALAAAIGMLGGLNAKASAPSGEVTVYPFAVCDEKSELFFVRANDKEVGVVHFTDYHYAHFSFSGAVDIEVTAPEKIEKVDISPHSAKVNYTVSENKLTFTVTGGKEKPDYYIIKINDLELLNILCDPPEENRPMPQGKNIYNVTDEPYNMDNSGKENITQKINTLIEEVGKNGGGTIYFPPGVYKTAGRLLVKYDNIHIYLSGGAVIKCSEDRKDYDSVAYTDFALVFEDTANCSLTGRGTLDASGSFLFNKTPNSADGKYPERRQVFIASRCKNFLLDGIFVKDGTTWTVQTWDCDDVLIRNVKVIDLKASAGYIVQNDGIDICGSRNVLVEKCFVMNVDDAFCSKSIGSASEVKNIVAANNVLFSNCAGLKVGMQSWTRMYDVWMIDNDIVEASRGFGVEQLAGNAVMYDIHFINNNVEKIVDYVPPVYSTVKGRNMEFNTTTASQIKIEIANCNFEESKQIIFDAKNSNIISDINFSNVTFAGKKVTDTSFFSFTKDCQEFVKNISFDEKEISYVIDFNDTNGHWARNSIVSAARKGIIQGVGNSNFAPEESLTRADFIILLLRALQVSPGEGTYSYDDVDSNSYYAKFISCAKETGIIKQTSGNFRPIDSISREEAAEFIMNAADAFYAQYQEGTEKELEQFIDKDEIGTDFVNVLANAVKNNIIVGDGGCIYPKDKLTRAEGAIILTRARNLINAEFARLAEEAVLPVVDDNALMDDEPYIAESVEKGFSYTTPEALMNTSGVIAAQDGVFSIICGGKGNVYWNPSIDKSGRVEVMVWIPGNSSSVKQTYTVCYNNRATQKIIAPYDYEKSQWVSLGEYTFSGQGNEYLMLSCPGNGKNSRIAETKFILKDYGDEEILIKHSR